MSNTTLSETPQWKRSLTKSLRHKGFVLGAIIILLILGIALGADFLAPTDPYEGDLANKLIKPFWLLTEPAEQFHWLGTDHQGRDYLSRLMYGARISLVIGFTVMLISGTIGITLGIMAGYFGGKIDAIISYLITTRLSMPIVLIALATSHLLGGSETTVILLLGFLLWDRFAVVTRSATMQVREIEFVTAAKAMGASTPYILFREIMPNLVGAIAVVATLEMAHAILLESTLSFLGLGVLPPEPSWGGMIFEAKRYMYIHPWLIMIPGVALAVLVLAINLVGDGLRDILSPDSRH